MYFIITTLYKKLSCHTMNTFTMYLRVNQSINQSITTHPSFTTNTSTHPPQRHFVIVLLHLIIVFHFLSPGWSFFLHCALLLPRHADAGLVVLCWMFFYEPVYLVLMKHGKREREREIPAGEVVAVVHPWEDHRPVWGRWRRLCWWRVGGGGGGGGGSGSVTLLLVCHFQDLEE